MTSDLLIGLAIGGIIGGTLGALAMAIAAAAGAADAHIARMDDAPAPANEEVATLRHHLSVCQAAAESQRQRADYYYDLFCSGAKANADLRRAL